MNGKLFLHVPPPAGRNSLYTGETQFVTGHIAPLLDASGGVEVYRGWGRRTGENIGKNTGKHLFWKWFFHRFSGPAHVKKSGAGAVAGFGETPIRLGSISQIGPIRQKNVLLSLSKAASKTPSKGSSNSKAPVENRFSPDPLVAEAAGIPFLPGFAPPGTDVLSWEERERVKDELSSGKEYFLTLLDAHDIPSLTYMLKAFTLFKQRQRTGMVWLFAGTAPHIASFTQLAATYKLRADLATLPIAEPLLPARWVEAAYAVVHLPAVPSWQLPVYSALAGGTPVITTPGCREITGGDGGLFTPPEPSSLSEELKRIYKDENLRSQLVARGMERSRRFSPAHTSQVLRSWF